MPAVSRRRFVNRGAVLARAPSGLGSVPGEVRRAGSVNVHPGALGRGVRQANRAGRFVASNHAGVHGKAVLGVRGDEGEVAAATLARRLAARVAHCARNLVVLGARCLIGCARA